MPTVVPALGAGAGHRTLNISEPQVLLRMDPPGPQPYWHHILLVRVEVARWITADPHGQLSCDDLSV